MVSRMDQIIKYVLFLVVCVSFTQTASGQTLKGRVFDEKNEPLPFVTVSVINQNKGTTTDLDGFYELDISEEGDSVAFSFISFKTKTIFTQPKELNVVLKNGVSELDEVVVISERKNESEISLIADKKNSMGVESSLGSKEISKKGISDAEGGLKKVSGVTFNSSKITVRGLGDRYNQVTLNRNPLPSNNLDRKNLDLTLLPSSIMGNMKVRKSYTSNQWSNLAGSQIDITTGFLKDINSIGVKVGTTTNGALPIQSSSIVIGREGVRNIGFLFTFNQRLNNELIQGRTRLYNRQGNNILDYDYNNNVSSLNTTGMLIGKYTLKKLTFNTISLLINSSRSENKISEGTHFDYVLPITTIRNSPSNHLLFTQQFITKYNDGSLRINSNLSYSLVNSGENNRTQFVYLYDGGYQYNNIDKIDNHTFSNQNKQNNVTLSLNASYDFVKFQPEIGYSYFYLDNKFDYQQEYYDLANANNLYYNIDINDPSRYINENGVVYQINDPASLVIGNTNIHSLYYRNYFNLNKIDLSFGLRVELVNQQIEFRDQVTPIFIRNFTLENIELLPYLNLKYKINSLNQLRLTSSITTVRPRFREMTPFIYTEVFAGSKIQGNPELSNTTIYNLDLSYEIYPKNGELISFTLFGKWLDRPIERINIATASGRLETYQNSQSAYVFGGELETKKRINKLTIDYNLSLLYSQINITDNNNSSVIVTNFNRPLQGSTPILSNLDVFYNISDNLHCGLTYNLIGPKLYSVGVLGLGDVYQNTQNFLNFICNYTVNRFDISLNVNNILNTKVERTQNTEIGDLVTDEYQLPTQFKLGLKYTF